MSRLAALSSLLVLFLGLGCDTGPAGPASVRIGHFIPDVPGPQAIDVCLKPDGTSTYSGKLVQNGGLNFASVSARNPVDAGTYSLRIVAANAPDCSNSLGGVGDIGGIGLDGDATVTVALVGLFSGTGSTSVAAKTLADDTAAAAAPAAKLRYVHFSPELGQVDVGVLSNGTFFELNPAVSLAYAGNTQYFPYTNGASGTLALLDSGTSNLRLSGSFSAAGGSVSTLYIVGRPSQTSGDPRLSFLLCNENAASCTRFP
jgi:hypothetical protein